MQSKRDISYSSTQFTMGDLRQIVTENVSVPADAHVNLTISEPYRGEFGPSNYYIEIES